jgi:hypothetical protein
MEKKIIWQMIGKFIQRKIKKKRRVKFYERLKIFRHTLIYREVPVFHAQETLRFLSIH